MPQIFDFGRPNRNLRNFIMKRIIFLLLAWAVMVLLPVYSQTTRLDINKLQAVSVSLSSAKIMKKDTIRIIKDPAVKEFDEPTFAKLKGVNFKNGTIEVKVLSRLLKDAPETARGFIGVAFRINESNSKFLALTDFVVGAMTPAPEGRNVYSPVVGLSF